MCICESAHQFEENAVVDQCCIPAWTMAKVLSACFVAFITKCMSLEQAATQTRLWERGPDAPASPVFAGMSSPSMRVMPPSSSAIRAIC